MSKWYRLLVAFTATAMVCCTAGMAYVCAEIWNAGAGKARVVWEDDDFQWSNGLYDVRGRMADGLLEELNIRRLRVALEES